MGAKLPAIKVPFTVAALPLALRTPPPMVVEVFPVMDPPLSVNVPESIYTPPPASSAKLPETVDFEIV